MTKRALFVVPHRRDRSPSQRFRFEQFLPALEEDGWQIDFSNLLDEEDDRVLYSRGNLLKKARVYLECRRKRARDVRRAHLYDVVFIHREAMMTGTTRYERRIAHQLRTKGKPGAKILYDFDDAIWLESTSENNRRLAFLKNPKKTAELIALADLVFAGNRYLADYAKPFNDNVEIVPTTIDTDYHRRVEVPDRPKDQICLGWSGSPTTIPHFEHALPALRQVKAELGDRVRFKVIGDPEYRNDELGIVGVPWTKESEVRELSDLDIGIMPLPDDEWTRGKCGLKGLSYMALGIATVMSPVGVNTEIVEHGVNGMLASSQEEWVAALSELVRDSELRERLGAASRSTVVDEYSVAALESSYVSRFDPLER